MEKLFEYGLLAFTSLFTMINPLGIIPVYTALTANMPQKEARQVAYKAVTTALFTLLFFAFGGKFIFDFFQISVNSMRIVGGIIFFMAGFDMLQARLIRTKTDQQEMNINPKDIAITPLAIPIICGPGAISAAIVMMNDAHLISHKLILLTAIFIVLIITLIILLGSRKIISFLGESGNKVLMRIMGLIVMVIAVEFFVSGAEPIIREILKIN